jgi:glycosyltransferase involved in cell wall biosynthesis
LSSGRKGSGIVADPIRVYLPIDPYDLHYIYQESYENPPDGVEYIYSPTDDDEAGGYQRRAIEGITDFLKRRSDLRPKLYRRYWKWKNVSDLGTDTPDFDIYHNRSAARRRSKLWVQECEHVGTVIGRDWREKLDDRPTLERVQRALASDECKAIMPHTEAAAESIRETIPNSAAFEEKLTRVPIAYEPPSDASVDDKPDDGVTRFLFVGSKFFDAQFYIKGGDKVLRAFDQIRDSVDAELTVRSDVPADVVETYRNHDDVTLLTDVVPRDELNDFMRHSDVFVFPSAQGTPGMVFREAMGYGMSIIGLDIWGNDELVEDGNTGFLIDPDESFQYLYPGKYVPVVGTGSYFTRRGDRSLDDIVQELTANDEALVERLAERMAQLASEPDLCIRRGRAGRRKITEGPLSLAKRNEKLRRIYRTAI